jgi:hypothetical protein
VAFDVTAWDTHGMHESAIDSTRVTCVAGGLYIITARLEWASNPIGWRTALLRVNDTNNAAYDQRLAVNRADDPRDRGAGFRDRFTTARGVPYATDPRMRARPPLPSVERHYGQAVRTCLVWPLERNACVDNRRAAERTAARRGAARRGAAPA